MHDGALMLDPDGICTFANQTAVDITSQTRDELLGTRISELFNRDSVAKDDQYWEYRSLVNDLLTGDRGRDNWRQWQRCRTGYGVAQAGVEAFKEIAV